jgi:hypothetical protein
MSSDSSQIAPVKTSRQASTSSTTTVHQQPRPRLSAHPTTSCISRRVSMFIPFAEPVLTLMQPRKPTGHIPLYSDKRCLKARCLRPFLRICLQLIVPTCEVQVAHTLLQLGLQPHYHLLREPLLPRTRTCSRTPVVNQLHTHGRRPAGMAYSTSTPVPTSIAYHLSSTAVSVCF